MYIPTQSKKANHGIEGKGFTAYGFYMRACLCGLLLAICCIAYGKVGRRKGERGKRQRQITGRVYTIITNIIVPYTFLFHTYTVVAYIA